MQCSAVQSHNNTELAINTFGWIFDALFVKWTPSSLRYLDNLFFKE